MRKNKSKKTVQESKELPPKSYVKAGSVEEAQYLAQLQADILAVDDDFIQYVQNAGKPKDGKVETEMDLMNRYYCQRMLLSCVEPLSKGVGADSVVDSIGMYVGMCLTSPDFRKEIGASVRDTMHAAVERKAEKAGPNSIWAKQRDKILQEQNQGRLPLTPKSAALMEIGFSRRAYDEMRKPGTNIDEVMRQYQKAIDMLHTTARHDGIDAQVLRQTTNTIIGQMMEKDPSLIKYFNETAYDGVSRGEYHTVTETIQTDHGPEQVSKEVWSGEFQNDDGSVFTGSFTPRRPKAQEEHVNNMGNFLRGEFYDCRTADQLREKMHDENHKQVRNLYMEMMLADGMPIDEVETNTANLLRAHLQGWMDNNPDAVQSELHRRQQEQASQQQTGSTKGRGHEFDDRFGNMSDSYESQYM